ncbi:TetR/AcrR family transcriptional regulator [Nocardioides marinquilinus]|uniref:TetR/AcrR family transcriptional regulator n=1 Tax=Nocardioides marinquilinus TaxID=1210400 RepID=A0ABP9Q945_9ACTN
MARYPADHKPAVRRRLVETAGRRLKRDGIDGSGVAALVADAGLTNGAFYGHFASKDDLVAAVVADQVRAQAARVEAVPPGPASVEAFVDDYLAPSHRDDRAGGCPAAALLAEIGRSDLATRTAYTTGATALVDALAGLLDDGDSGDGGSARERAIGVLALLVGALQAARAVTDPVLSDAVLDAARRGALTLARPRTTPRVATHRESA